MELDTTGLEKVLPFVCVANGAVSSEIGDIHACDEGSTIAQASPFLSEKDVTQYASLEIFDNGGRWGDPILLPSFRTDLLYTRRSVIPYKR